MLIKNVNIYLTDNQLLSDSYLLIEGCIIKNYGPMSSCPQDHSTTIDGNGFNLLPGFIDEHIHGGYGGDFMDEDNSIDTILSTLPQEGTTSILATTLTQSETKLKSVLKFLGNYINNQNNESKTIIEGIHFEGPFLNTKFKGAQNEAYILNPDVKLMEEYHKTSLNNIKMVSFACELASKEFQLYLENNNILQGVVHSDATYQEVKQSIENGLKIATHFHNGSSPHHHRRPGVVSAGLGLNMSVELICDTIHLHPDVIEMVANIKDFDDIILITDSMRAKGLNDGTYDLGGLDVYKKGNEARLSNNDLAGSCAKMDECARNFKKFTNATLHDIVKVTSTNAAKAIGISDRVGSIEIGKLANLVICDDNINIKTTIINGGIAYNDCE